LKERIKEVNKSAKSAVSVTVAAADGDFLLKDRARVPAWKSVALHLKNSRDSTTSFQGPATAPFGTY
jgi:hypothetical protein